MIFDPRRLGAPVRELDAAAERANAEQMKFRISKDWQKTKQAAYSRKEREEARRKFFEECGLREIFW